LFHLRIFPRETREKSRLHRGLRFSGKFIVRVSPEIHGKIALKAMAHGDSLNQYITETLAKA
jgi:predicted HicB family RNase H-like nuclease